MRATVSDDEDDDGACGARTGESDSGRRRAAWGHRTTPPAPRYPALGGDNPRGSPRVAV